MVSAVGVGAIDGECLLKYDEIGAGGKTVNRGVFVLHTWER